MCFGHRGEIRERVDVPMLLHDGDGEAESSQSPELRVAGVVRTHLNATEHTTGIGSGEPDHPPAPV